MNSYYRAVGTYALELVGLKFFGQLEPLVYLLLDVTRTVFTALRR